MPDELATDSESRDRSILLTDLDIFFFDMMISESNLYLAESPLSRADTLIQRLENIISAVMLRIASRRTCDFSISITLGVAMAYLIELYDNLPKNLKKLIIHSDEIGVRRMEQSGEGFECVKIGPMVVDLGNKLLLPHASKILNITSCHISLFLHSLI